jgi:hypothetical protein
MPRMSAVEAAVSAANSGERTACPLWRTGRGFNAQRQNDEMLTSYLAPGQAVEFSPYVDDYLGTRMCLACEPPFQTAS